MFTKDSKSLAGMFGKSLSKSVILAIPQQNSLIRPVLLSPAGILLARSRQSGKAVGIWKA